MPTDNSVENIKSRYTQGGDTESYEKRLGWWERDLDTVKRKNNDITITLAPKYDRRPDVFAADYLGRSDLEWVVLQFNTIVDINVEFRAGKQIRMPSSERVLFDFLNKGPGGVTPRTQIT